MSYDDENTTNLAETLAKVLPKATLLAEVDTANLGNALLISHYAIPRETEVKEFKVDLEYLLPNTRATKGAAKLAGPADFLAYVERHKKPETMVWCKFNPQDFALSFTAVIDEHANTAAGWRRHTAVLDPLMSAEWKLWKVAQDRKSLPQVAFAEFIQENYDDIASTDESIAAGYPTALQMMTMATNFVHNEERQLKSAVRLQNGGVRMTYVADADEGTVAEMSMFEKFRIGIPVFHDAGAWAIDARLKYRNNSGKLSFTYELVRADRVHQAAAEALIEQVKTGLGDVPMMFGAFGA